MTTAEPVTSEQIAIPYVDLGAQHASIKAKSPQQISQRPAVFNPLIARLPVGVDPVFGPGAPTVDTNSIDEIVGRA